MNVYGEVDFEIVSSNKTEDGQKLKLSHLEPVEIVIK